MIEEEGRDKVLHTEWGLGDGGGVARTLLRRSYFDNEEGVWQQVARFDDYNDAEWVLRLIRLGQRVGEPTTALGEGT